MFPIAHSYLVEKYFGKVTNGYLVGSIAPDLISNLLNFSFEETHKRMTGFSQQNIERSYNLHVESDNYTEEKYFYRLTYKHEKLRKHLGLQKAHLFVEAGFDYVLLENGFFYEFPKIEKSLVQELENYFGKNMAHFKFVEYLSEWDTRNSYPKFLTKTLGKMCFWGFRFLTHSQINRNIQSCVDMLEKKFGDCTCILDEFLEQKIKI